MTKTGATGDNDNNYDNNKDGYSAMGDSATGDDDDDICKWRRINNEGDGTTDDGATGEDDDDDCNGRRRQYI